MPRLWIDTFVSAAIANNSTFAVSLSVGVTSLESRLQQMTLLRTIIGIDIAATVHDSGEGSQLVTPGIAIASQEAFTVGATADPEISTDFPTRGWIWRAQYRIYGFAADQPAVFNRRVDLDIRAMRKLENGEAFITIRNQANEGVAFAVSVFGLIRQLWLVG